VSLFQFLVATLFILPKVIVYVFVGSRIARLSDGEQRNHMDTRKNTCHGIPISLIHAHRNKNCQQPSSCRWCFDICFSQLVRVQVTAINNRTLLTLYRLVYHLMQKEIKRLHDSPSRGDELAAEALEAAEEAPLLGSDSLSRV
jgi:hypothetical protein